VSAEIVIAIFAVLITPRTNNGTFRATVSVITNILDTVSADVAIITPTVIAHTSLALAAVGTQISRTVGTLLSTPFTYLGALRASFSADANIGRAVATGAASGTEISFSAGTVDTGTAAAANILFFTICAFFVTFRANGRAIRAALPAITGGHAFSAGITVRAPAGIPYATDAVAAIGTELTRTVFALLTATLTDSGTAIATAAALTDYDTSTAASAIGAPAVIILGTVFTHNAADLTKKHIFAIGAGLPAAFTKRCTIAAPFPAIAKHSAGTAGIAVCANIVISYAVGAFFTFFTDPIGALNTFRTAALANNLTVFTTAFTALADSYATLPKTTSIAEIL